MSLILLSHSFFPFFCFTNIKAMNTKILINQMYKKPYLSQHIKESKEKEKFLPSNTSKRLL